MGTWLLSVLAGAVTGVLSGLGLGGGTLLLIYMTAFAGLPQALAQGINLLYFLPAAGCALPSHAKNGYLDRRVILPAALTGLLTAGLASLAATALPVALLRRFFGFFLLCMGLSELFRPKA